MDIYLVRVSERPDKSLFVERKASATTNDDYIAISHVWGTPETIQPTHVDGAGVVPLSPRKKDILSILRRDDVCGESWFWMDLFASTKRKVLRSSSKVLYARLGSLQRFASSPTRMETWMGSKKFLAWRRWHMAESVPTPSFAIAGSGDFGPAKRDYMDLLSDVVVLNPAACTRLQVSPRSDGPRWIAEGTVLAKRTIAESFLFDKFAYRGLPPPQLEKVGFKLYLDFVYRHRVDIKKYGDMAGPAPSYSPFSEAWRSGRITTKPRDYVLAVFPDISGYKAPLNARKMRFPELLADALGQTPIRERFLIAPKVPKGMMLETSSKESATSWMFQEPSNIGEAYDSVAGLLAEDPSRSSMDGKFFAVAKSITLEELDLSSSNMSEIKDLWVKTADNIKHMALASPSGPCAGGMRMDVQTVPGRLHQYFLHQFAPLAAAQYLPGSKPDTLVFRSGSAFDQAVDISSDVFSHELRRFLICLLCGTSLRTADIISDSADFRLVSTTYGKLLALMHRETISKARQEDFVLITTPLWYVQGFLVGVQTGAGIVIVGRTVIPTSEIWEAVEGAI